MHLYVQDSFSPTYGTTQYLYGNPGNPFQLTASRSTDNTLTTYSYDTSGNLFAFERAGARYYVATDHLGTPKVVTYDNGTIVKQTEYDAWGLKLSDSAPAFDLPVGFAGGIPEPVTGLVRFGFRDYEPGTGRWVARDPILFEGGQGNLFQYSNNDPNNFMDKSGLHPGQRFDTAGEAARDAINYIWSEYPDSNTFEYGGWIYSEKDSNGKDKYYYCKPLKGERRWIPNFPIYRPAGASKYWYHTQSGNVTGGDRFMGGIPELPSGPDTGINNVNGSIGYMGYNGNIFKFGGERKFIE